MEHKALKQHSAHKSTTWVLGTVAVLLAIALVVSIFTNGFGGKPATKTLTPDQVKAKALTAVQSLVQGQTVTIDSVVDNGDVYALALNVGGQKFNSYATKDGKLLFPSGVDMNTVANTPSQQTATPPQHTPTSVPKTDKPTVELFVMAYCPYGTQAEKGILPAVRTLGDKIDFKVRFVYYAMHGQKEVYENLAQYCIQSEQPQVYEKYLACFLNASDQTGCITTTGVDKTKLDACTAAADTKFNVTANFNDKASWLSGQFPIMNFDYTLNQKYGVQGSPTLVINGVQSNAGRDSESFLKGICAAFNNAPAECNTQLSATPPGPGFGYDSTGSAQAAGCGV